MTTTIITIPEPTTEPDTDSEPIATPLAGSVTITVTAGCSSCGTEITLETDRPVWVHTATGQADCA